MTVITWDESAEKWAAILTNGTVLRERSKEKLERALDHLETIRETKGREDDGSVLQA